MICILRSSPHRKILRKLESIGNEELILERRFEPRGQCYDRRKKRTRINGEIGEGNGLVENDWKNILTKNKLKCYN